MPKRVLVPSLKVKRLIRLFDGSPSKMTKKKAVTSAPAAAAKSAAALAHMAKELEREEVAASSDPAAPAANMSSKDALAVFDIFIPSAKKSDSDLMARGGQQRRHSDGEGTAATGTGLAAGDSQTPKGSAPALSGVASTPKGARPRWPSPPS